jgi:hypothetical protein
MTVMGRQFVIASFIRYIASRDNIFDQNDDKDGNEDENNYYAMTKEGTNTRRKRKCV